MQAGILTAAAMSSVLFLSTAGALELDPGMEAKRLEAGLARLCGVWEWTVHSHTLSHREAKSKIVLPSADAAGVAGPPPAQIPGYRDAGYFRRVHNRCCQEG